MIHTFLITNTSYYRVSDFCIAILNIMYCNFETLGMYIILHEVWLNTQ